MRRATKLLTALLVPVAFVACGGGARTSANGDAAAMPRVVLKATPAEIPTEPYAGKMIYVLVALCDNVNQGIVPVAPALGNGDDAERNLYWGARFGVKTFFTASRDWRFVSSAKNPAPKILERLVFKHRTKDALLVADAYRGAEIKQATADFLSAASGASTATASVEGRTYGLSRGAASHLVAYVGHDGLMDFRLSYFPKKRDNVERDAVILACASKSYFAEALRETGAHPLLWTTNLMAPEAYVLNAAVDGWLAGEAGEEVRLRAARAYHSYQNCGLKAAQNLFASGW
ncbi:MAG TPA: hypothetical protein VEX60_08995 [Pyrinomonadaceae bacterium]|nr:hypothetical protein [Pyrinomonadaceae bacterium]